MNKQKFTLIELMFTIAILIILIGIGAAAMNKVFRRSVDVQTSAEIKMIQSAMSIYKTRYSSYPPMTDPEIITCADYLRKVKVQKNNGQYRADVRSNQGLRVIQSTPLFSIS